MARGSLRPGSGTQLELVVSDGLIMDPVISPVSARQPSSSSGRYWIFLSLRFTMRVRPLRSVATKLAIDRGATSSSGWVADG